MQKSPLLVTVAIIAIAAIFLIPSTYSPTYAAKASQCSSSGAVRGGSITISGSVSGSCSTGITNQPPGFGIIGFNSGSKSSCSGVSAGQHSLGADSQGSNGAVSCSSHSP